MRDYPAQDRRRFRRVRMQMPARLLIQNHVECSGTAIALSATCMAITTRQSLKRGDQIVAYLHGVDRFEGTVHRQMGNVFAMTLKLSQQKRERIVEILTVELARQNGILAPECTYTERRAALRRHCVNRDSMCTLESGLSIRCSIVDMSLTGLGIKIEPVLKIDETVRIGRMKARVVRKTHDGYGLELLGLAEEGDTVHSIFSKSRLAQAKKIEQERQDNEDMMNSVTAGGILASSTFMQAVVKPTV